MNFLWIFFYFYNNENQSTQKHNKSYAKEYVAKEYVAEEYVVKEYVAKLNFSFASHNERQQGNK